MVKMQNSWVYQIQNFLNFLKLVLLLILAFLSRSYGKKTVSSFFLGHPVVNLVNSLGLLLSCPPDLQPTTIFVKAWGIIYVVLDKTMDVTGDNEDVRLQLSLYNI